MPVPKVIHIAIEVTVARAFACPIQMTSVPGRNKPIKPFSGPFLEAKKSLKIQATATMGTNVGR